LTSGNVTLQTELPDRPVFACLDVEQVQRALVTLLLEIPQATEARRLKLSVSGSHDRVVVSLWFECRHLCREDVESLFEPFTDKRVGHGLSLALAKRFVENQAGTLQTDSIQNDTRIVMSFRASASTRRETPAEPGTHVEMVDALPGVADARLQVRARPDGGRSREGRAVLSRVETPS
jgi:nitrogen fixation/metabolism regulation signal transduction histidine kinase